MSENIDIFDAGRPSDGTGRIIRQPTMVSVDSGEGSHKMAHNTPDASRDILKADNRPIKLRPLIVNGEHLHTGDQAKAARAATRILRSKIREELHEFDDFPNNPKRIRLLEKRKELDITIKHCSNFLDQWTKLDNTKYLYGLIRKNDDLSEEAKRILDLRNRRKDPNFTQDEKNLLIILSDNMRDKLAERIRDKGKNNKNIR